MSTANQSLIEDIAKGNFPENVLRNAAPAVLYEEAVRFDNAMIVSSGAVAVSSGEKQAAAPKTNVSLNKLRSKTTFGGAT
ncbi:MAG: hypothetical protein R3C03_11905 [Pirellulaceae bacterium]